MVVAVGSPRWSEPLCVCIALPACSCSWRQFWSSDVPPSDLEDEPGWEDQHTLCTAVSSSSAWFPSLFETEFLALAFKHKQAI